MWSSRRERPVPCLSPFSATERDGLDFDGVAVGRNAARHRARINESVQQLEPEAPVRPPNETVVDRRRRAILARAVAPRAAKLLHVKMPEVTRRSSTCFASGWCLGRSGSTATHALSGNRNSDMDHLQRPCSVPLNQKSERGSSH